MSNTWWNCANNNNNNNNNNSNNNSNSNKNNYDNNSREDNDLIMSDKRNCFNSRGCFVSKRNEIQKIYYICTPINVMIVQSIKSHLTNV